MKKKVKEEILFYAAPEDAPGVYNWKQAHDFIALLNFVNYLGFCDWRLPTKEELNIMYKRKNVVGGFADNYYWSSTEFGNYSAWEQFFPNGNQNYDYKNFTLYIRAVRG